MTPARPLASTTPDATTRAAGYLERFDLTPAQRALATERLAARIEPDTTDKDLAFIGGEVLHGVREELWNDVDEDHAENWRAQVEARIESGSRGSVRAAQKRRASR